MTLNVHGIQAPKEKLNQIWIIPFTNVAQRQGNAKTVLSTVSRIANGKRMQTDD